MKYLILLMGKIITKVMKLSNRRATTLPGRIASSINKNFPSKFKMPDKVIFVTGTNGKTSTANLITHMLEESGFKVVNNSKGANLLSGITSILIQNSDFALNVNADYAVFEVDESTMPSISKQIKSDYVVITNFFRDQLDRHFEISQVIDKVKNSIQPDAKLVVNADDALTYNLVSELENEKIYYSMDKNKYSSKNEPMVREARYCFKCKNKLVYKYFNYGHFGDYTCNKCGFTRPIADYKIESVNLDEKYFVFNNIKYTMQSNELYTVYNFAMALSLGKDLDLDYKKMRNSVASFKLNNSRMEGFLIDKKNVKLNIVKNQIGFDATVEAFLLDKGPKTFIYTLNNNFADSIDTSWIWDCNYSLLKNSNIKKFVCTGMRRYELATRLSLENPDFEIEIVDSKEQAFDNIKNYDGNVYIISAYTAHMATSDYLKKLQENKGEKKSSKTQRLDLKKTINRIPQNKKNNKKRNK